MLLWGTLTKGDASMSATSEKVALIFTAKSVETLLKEGGTSSWRLDRNHARHCTFAVCTRNAHADWVEGPEAHHAAFIVGKVSDVVPAPTRPGRYLITFSEYALVDVPNVWQGDRNPVRYSTLDEIKKLGVDIATLKWMPMPPPAPEDEDTEVELPPARADGKIGALTMSDAKKGLALTFGVAPEAIEITIRG
jgi:hypothetical protein